MSKRPPLLLSVRLIVTVLLFLATTIQYTHKTGISVGVLCMVNHTALNDSDKPSKDKHFSNNSNGVNWDLKNISESKNPDGPFLWDKNKQELIMAAYYYGDFFSNILGGYLAFKIGPKIVLFVSILVGSIMTCLVPITATWNLYALITCRIINGFFEGTMWPTLMVIFVSWMPPEERGVLIGFITCGAQFGIMIGFSLSGYLCVHGFDGGWPSIFYCFGGVGILWSIAWLFLFSDKPVNHKFMTRREKKYFTEISRYAAYETEYKAPTPWKEILTSKSCILLYIVTFTTNWSLSLFTTNVPTYMKEVLKFEIQSNGLLSTLPYILLIIIVIISGIIADVLISKRVLRRNTVRAMCNIIGLFPPAVLLILLSFIKCNQSYLAVVILTFGIALGGTCSGGGYFLSFNEVAGSHSGVLYGIANTVGQSNGFIVPMFIAAITKNNTQSEWGIVFYVTAALGVIGGVISLFIKSDLEPWAIKKDNQIKAPVRYGTIN